MMPMAVRSSALHVNCIRPNHAASGNLRKTNNYKTSRYSDGQFGAWYSFSMAADAGRVTMKWPWNAKMLSFCGATCAMRYRLRFLVSDLQGACRTAVANTPDIAVNVSSRHAEAHRPSIRLPQVKRAAFFGASLPSARRGAVAAARTPQLVVRAAQQISADVEKPIGLTFKESKAKGGGLVVTVSFGVISKLHGRTCM